MSIQSEIDRINSNVQAALNAVADTGVSVPENANSNDLPAAVLALANEKQDKLTFDATPTANSTNPVTSGGVKTELDKKASATSLGAHTGNTDNPHQVTAAQAGADPTGTAASAVSAHNSSATAHSDIRTALAGKETAGAAAAVQSNLDVHTGNTTVHITAAERTSWNGKADAPKSVSVTLAAASWDATAKTQTVTVTGVSATETAQMITPTPALASQTAYYDAGILCTGQAANSLTFTADVIPTADLTVYVVIQEVTHG